MIKKMKLLIGYDGSDCAEAALDDLCRAGLPREETEVIVLSLTEVWMPPPPPSSYEIIEAAQAARTPADLQQRYAHNSQAVEEAHSLALRASQRIQKMFPDWKVSAEAGCGSPACELINKADEWKPDLIIVGSHGRSALGRFVMGSVSQKVVTESRTSVRVARCRGRGEDYSPVRILVGVDGSPAAEAAVRVVAERAWPAQSLARVVTVDEPLGPTFIENLIPPVARAVEESDREDRQRSKRVVENAGQKLSQAKLIVSTVVREGDPKRVIIDEAEGWGADAIFLGSVGFNNRLERFLLGSVSLAVVCRAHCSVEVVRAEKEAP